MFHVGDVIKKLRGQRDWTLDDLAEKSGVHKTTLSALERGDSDPRTATVDSVARALGTSLQGLYGMFPADPSDSPARPEPSASRNIDLGAQGSDPSFVVVPLMDGRIAAGAPLVVDDLEVADHIAFPQALIEQLGVTKPRCVRVGRNERSMYPTIYPDAIVLLDCSDAKRARPVNGRIYAVNVDYGSTLKRVTVAGGVVFLSSDNGDKAEYPMREIQCEDDHTELPSIIVGEAMIAVNMLS